jgi:hypothetical protein
MNDEAPMPPHRAKAIAEANVMLLALLSLGGKATLRALVDVTMVAPGKAYRRLLSLTRHQVRPYPGLVAQLPDQVWGLTVAGTQRATQLREDVRESA